mmetsp:Transcript_99224/g.286293  ORF Transcript_99224/g.286293 Transcript_99224/m.286293 type:complete len:243 (-) Transcript_99224:789-1517(-)
MRRLAPPTNCCSPHATAGGRRSSLRSGHASRAGLCFWSCRRRPFLTPSMSSSARSAAARSFDSQSRTTTSSTGCLAKSGRVSHSMRRSCWAVGSSARQPHALWKWNAATKARSRSRCRLCCGRRSAAAARRRFVAPAFTWWARNSGCASPRPADRPDSPWLSRRPVAAASRTCCTSAIVAWWRRGRRTWTTTSRWHCTARLTMSVARVCSSSRSSTLPRELCALPWSLQNPRYLRPPAPFSS